MTIINFQENDFYNPVKDGNYGILAHARITLQWPTGRWFSPGPPVSSTNKIDRHDITEILLKVVLNTIKQTMVNVKIFKIERHHTVIQQYKTLIIKTFFYSRFFKCWFWCIILKLFKVYFWFPFFSLDI
jgi:hypothetical protein